MADTTFNIPHGESKTIKYYVINKCDNDKKEYNHSSWIFDNSDVGSITIDGSAVEGISLSKNDSEYSLTCTNNNTSTLSKNVKVHASVSSLMLTCDNAVVTFVCQGKSQTYGCPTVHWELDPRYTQIPKNGEVILALYVDDWKNVPESNRPVWSGGLNCLTVGSFAADDVQYEYGEYRPDKEAFKFVLKHLGNKNTGYIVMYAAGTNCEPQYSPITIRVDVETVCPKFILLSTYKNVEVPINSNGFAYIDIVDFGDYTEDNILDCLTFKPKYSNSGEIEYNFSLSKNGFSMYPQIALVFHQREIDIKSVLDLTISTNNCSPSSTMTIHVSIKYGRFIVSCPPSATYYAIKLNPQGSSDYITLNMYTGFDNPPVKIPIYDILRSYTSGSINYTLYRDQNNQLFQIGSGSASIYQTSDITISG